MILRYLLLISLNIFSYSINLSDDAKQGREVYIEANCQKCHNIDENYDGKGSYANEVFRLNRWVSQCMTYFNHSWFPEEKQNVVKYLNEIEYKIDLDKK